MQGHLFVYRGLVSQPQDLTGLDIPLSKAQRYGYPINRIGRWIWGISAETGDNHAAGRILREAAKEW